MLGVTAQRAHTVERTKLKQLKFIDLLNRPDSGLSAVRRRLDLSDLDVEVTRGFLYECARELRVRSDTRYKPVSIVKAGARFVIFDDGKRLDEEFSSNDDV